MSVETANSITDKKRILLKCVGDFFPFSHLLVCLSLCMKIDPSRCSYKKFGVLINISPIAQ